jgi:hypothetical protein
MQVRGSAFRRNAQQVVNIHRRSFLGGVFPPSSPYDEPNRHLPQDDLSNDCLLKQESILRFRRIQQLRREGRQPRLSSGWEETNLDTVQKRLWMLLILKVVQLHGL